MEPSKSALFFVLFASAFSLTLSASNPFNEGFIGCLSKKLSPNDKLSSIVYVPTNPAYPSVLEAYIRNRRYNKTTTPKPNIIVTPTNVSHVQATVICAKTVGIQIKIRSGGHDFDAVSYVSDIPFIILDMFNLRAVDVNIEEETAWIQAGATLGEVYYGIWKKSPVHGYPAGVCPTVGVGGHVSGGGYGTMLRKYGLASDNILDAQVVDVKGRVLDRKGMGEDLFWAIRGGGGASFCVVLSYKVQLVPVPKTVTVFRVERTMEQNATDVVHQFQYASPTIDKDLFIRLLLQPVTGTTKGVKTVRASFIAFFLGDSNRLLTIVGKQFPALGLQKSDCFEMSWIQAMLYWANFDNTTAPEALLERSYTTNFFKRKSDYIQTPITKDGLNFIFQKMIALGKTGLVFNTYGGKMSEIPATASPFPHRAGNLFKVQYSVNWQEVGIEAENNYMNQIRKLYEYMTPYVSKSPRAAFLNYRDLDIGVNDNGKNSYSQGQVYGLKYFQGNFDRLVKVKTMVDPDNFFRTQQSVPTLPK